MVGVEILQRNEPHYKPGYAGYCPRDRFQCGETYGSLSQKQLLDPTVSHADKLALVDTTKNYEVVKPSKEDIETVKSRPQRVDAVYKHPLPTTYAGFVPGLGGTRDKPFGIVATQGIANFDRQQVKREASRDHLKKLVDLQTGAADPRNLEDRLLLESKFKLPLIAVRPERAGVQKTHPVNERYLSPREYSTSPYFMDNLNPEKYFMNGFTGYIPYQHSHFGKPTKNASADGLREFTSKHLQKKLVEWAPVIIAKEKRDGIPHAPVVRNEIYKKDTALMPSYAGHVPGAKDITGKTFGALSKNANSYLEDKLFMLKLRKCEIPV